MKRSARFAVRILPAAFLLLASLPANAAETVEVTGTRNGNRACPLGQFVVGFQPATVLRNVVIAPLQLLCSTTPIVNSSAPYTASFELVDSSTTLEGAKACPTNYGVTGLSVANNRVSCAHIGAMEVSVDTATQRSGTHACPAGRVMVALDLAGGRIFCGRRVDRCFGALGQRCGIQGEGFTTPLALCLNGACLINAGSWEHDECCWRFPNGDTCRDVGVSHDGHCVTEFSKAVNRLAGGYNWRRSVNFGTLNTNGVVVANTFCAPNGTFVHRGDPNRCCSGRSRLMKDALADPLGAADDLAKATLQGVNAVEIASGNPRVCF